MLIEILKTIPDHRDPQGRECKLWEVLFISILALMNNAKTYQDIVTFTKVNFDTLKKHLGLKWRRPPTISGLYKIIVAIHCQKKLLKTHRLPAPSLLHK